jgi:hypothetical protein
LRDVADVYGVEIMRVYDHYRFRWMEQQGRKGKKKSTPPSLTFDESWTDPYFDGDAMKTSDRNRFCP